MSKNRFVRMVKICHIERKKIKAIFCCQNLVDMISYYKTIYERNKSFVSCSSDVFNYSTVVVLLLFIKNFVCNDVKPTPK